MDKSEVDRTLVRKLRLQTGVSVLECFRALVEAKNDYDKALTILEQNWKPIGMMDGDRR